MQRIDIETNNMKQIILYKRSKFVQLGTKNKLKQYSYKGKQLFPYESGYIQPKGKFWKRQANKKVRKSKCTNGNYFKKLYGWFEWS